MSVLGFWCDSYAGSNKAHCVQSCEVFFSIHCDPVLQMSSEIVCVCVCVCVFVCVLGCVRSVGSGFVSSLCDNFKIELDDRSYTFLSCWDLVTGTA